jgi:hypothetical protein
MRCIHSKYGPVEIEKVCGVFKEGGECGLDNAEIPEDCIFDSHIMAVIMAGADVPAHDNNIVHP